VFILVGHICRFKDKITIQCCVEPALIWKYNCVVYFTFGFHSVKTHKCADVLRRNASCYRNFGLTMHGNGDTAQFVSYLRGQHLLYAVQVLLFS